MMMLRNLKFALDSAWQSFWRNLAVSLAAVVSITLILILAGINLLVGHAFSQVLDGFRAKVSEMSINIADDTPLSTVYSFRDKLAGDPRVVSVKFVTKDEALAQFLADPNNAELTQQIVGNPLDAKLQVRVRNLSDVTAIDTMAQQWPGVDPTDPTNYQGDFVTRMLQLSQWLGIAGVALMSMLVIVSVVIVMNTIRTAVYHAVGDLISARGLALQRGHHVHPAQLRSVVHLEPGPRLAVGRGNAWRTWKLHRRAPLREVVGESTICRRGRDRDPGLDTALQPDCELDLLLPGRPA